MTTDTHGSMRCTLGPNGQPCEFCAWVERKQCCEECAYTDAEEASMQALLTDTITAVREDLNMEPEVAQRILTAIEHGEKYASLSTVRAAVFDVIDASCKHDGLAHEWRFNHPDEDFANAQRCDFIDAVTARALELQQPPHSFDARLPVREYARGYSDGWAEAQSVRLREENADLREMQRMVEGRMEK